MVHAKENLSFAFTTTRNHLEIEVMKESFQSTFGNLATEKQIQKLQHTSENMYVYATPYKCGTRSCDLCLAEK